MTSERDNEARKGGLILSALMMASDLESFRDRGVVSEAADLDDLRHAKALLTKVARALLSGDAEQWAELRRLVVETGSVESPPVELAGDVASAPAVGAESKTTAQRAIREAPMSPPAASIASPPAVASPPPVRIAHTDGLPRADGVLAVPARVDALPGVADAHRHDDIDSTVSADLVLSLGDPLPFSGSSEPPLPTDDETAHEAIGGTAILNGPLVTESDLPFGCAQEPSAPVSQLSTHEYAALCAERAAGSSAFGQLCQRHHLATAEDVASVDQAWQARLRQDEALRAEFNAAYDRYAKWLSERS